MATATTDSNGALTFRFPPAGSGVVVYGTLSIPGAPIGAQFQVTNGGGLTVGTFAGYNPWGPVTAFPSEALVVLGTGLAANTPYSCVWVAYQTTLDEAPQLPTPYGGITTINNTSSNPVTIVTPTPPGAVALTNTYTIASTGVKQQLGSFALTVGVAIYALKANAASVNVGGSNVTSSSYTLEAGTGLVFPIDNSNIIWILGTAGDKVSVWGS